MDRKQSPAKKLFAPSNDDYSGNLPPVTNIVISGAETSEHRCLYFGRRKDNKDWRGKGLCDEDSFAAVIVVSGTFCRGGVSMWGF